MKNKFNEIILNVEYIEENFNKLVAENATLKDMLEQLKEENKHLLSCLNVRNNES